MNKHRSKRKQAKQKRYLYWRFIARFCLLLWKLFPVVLILALIVLLDKLNLGSKVAERYQRFLEDVPPRLGFQISKIQISGIKHITKSEILGILGKYSGKSILGLDLAEVKQQLEALPWAKSVVIQRIFPDKLHIVMIERSGAFLMEQQAGEALLYDEFGRHLTTYDYENYKDLPKILGKAPLSVIQELLAIVRSMPQLMKDLTKLGWQASWVDDRRWDIYLSGKTAKIKVKLPQAHLKQGLARLGVLLTHKGYNFTGIEGVDLRLGDRVILSLSPEGMVKIKGKEGVSI